MDNTFIQSQIDNRRNKPQLETALVFSAFRRAQQRTSVIRSPWAPRPPFQCPHVPSIPVEQMSDFIVSLTVGMLKKSESGGRAYVIFFPNHIPIPDILRHGG